MFETLSLTVPVPCVHGVFGQDLDTFQTQVKPAQIQNLLGHDPRSKNWPKLPDELQRLYQHLQRKTSKDRRTSTKRYIQERIAPGSRTLGAFPAISIGLVKPATFIPYRPKGVSGDSTGIPEAVGILQLDLSQSTLRVLLDGLGRVTGALDLIDEGNGKIADSFSFPVTIFAPTAKRGEVGAMELGQLFHDFNFLAIPVGTAQAIDLDQSNIYVELANELSRSEVLKEHGGVEARAMSLGKKSTALVAKPVLVRFVRGACEGLAFQHTLRDMPDENANLTHETFNAIEAKIETFLSKLADRMGDRFSDKESLHLTAPGWNAMGVIFNDITFGLRGLTPAIEDDIINRIADINWSRSNQEWVGMMGDKDEKSPGHLKLYGGHQAITKLISFIRDRSGLAAHFAAKELKQQYA
jgi:hypothetical protein